MSGIHSKSSIGEGKKEDNERLESRFPLDVTLPVHGNPSVQVHTTRPPLVEHSKSAFTLAFQTPLRPTISSRPIAPAPISSAGTHNLPTNVAVTQPLIAKPVARVSSADSGSSVAATPSSLTVRHAVSVPSVTMPLGSGTMASIIRSSHIQPGAAAAAHIAQAISSPYSSHVPRGPAAVASITPPRSAVATPILRPALSQPTASVPQGASSSASHHPQIQPRSPAIPSSRTPTPPVPKAASPAVTLSQVSDIHRSSLLPNTTTTVHVAAPPLRSSEPLVRSSMTHTGNVPKPIHISPPFVQNIHQLATEKGYYKPTSVAPAALLPTQQVPPSQQSQATGQQSQSATQSSSIITSTPTNAITSNPLLVPHPTAQQVKKVIPQQQGSVSTHLVPAPHLAQAISQLHPAQSKIVPQAIHTVAPIPHHQPTVTVSSASNRSNLAAHLSPQTTSVTISQGMSRQTNTTTIPIAKVHPQPLPVQSRTVEPVENNAPVGLLLSSSHRASPSQSAPGNSVTSLPAGVVLMEAQTERPAVQQPGSYTLSTTYYYEPYQNTLPMSSYGGPSAAHTFSSSGIRPGLLSSHQSSAMTSTRTGSSTTVSPMMVTVDPAHPLTLHTAYTSSAEGTVVTAEPVVSNTVTSTVYSVSSTASVGTSYTSSQTLGTGTTPSTSSSPRPSILRKRTNEGTSVVVRKNLLPSITASEPPSPHPDTTSSSSTTLSATSSPKPSSDTVRENGISLHTDVNENSITSTVLIPAANIKQEPLDISDNCIGSKPVSNSLGSSCVNLPVVEASPRKKPRKQQLTGNDLIETHSTDGEDDFEKDSKENLRKEIVREDEDGVRWVTSKQRPPITLLNSYRHTWKSRHNHFLKYTDVKPKGVTYQVSAKQNRRCTTPEERHPTVNDLANQKGVMQKVRGWKIYHLCSQMDDLVDLEDSVHSRLADFLGTMEKDHKVEEDRDLNKVSELIKGNLQRCKIIREQMHEAKQQVLKVTDHKTVVTDIITKYHTKRPVKKKDKS